MCLWVNGDKFVCSPRIAAQAIVRLVNSTKVNQAMLALTVSFFFLVFAQVYFIHTLS